MATTNRILSLTAAVLTLVPAAAFANNGVQYDVNGRYDGAGIELGIHLHTSNCRHDAPPPPPPRAEPQGRYEIRTVQKWIPGYQEKVWVAEQCTTVTKHKDKHGKHKGKGKKHGHYKHETVTRTVCEPGHYATRWVEGRHVNEEQWVWVSYSPPHHPSRPVVVSRR